MIRVRNDVRRYAMTVIAVISVASFLTSLALSFESFFDSPGRSNGVVLGNSELMQQALEGRVSLDRFWRRKNRQQQKRLQKQQRPPPKRGPKHFTPVISEAVNSAPQVELDPSLDSDDKEIHAVTDLHVATNIEPKATVQTSLEEIGEEATNDYAQAEPVAEPVAEPDANETDAEVEHRDIVQMHSEASESQPKSAVTLEVDREKRLETYVNPIVQAKYSVSDAEREACIEDLTNLVAHKSYRTSNNVHDRLQSHLEDLSIISACSTSRTFVGFNIPHFNGGKQQIRKYFNERGWSGVFKHRLSNRTATGGGLYPEVPEEGIVAFIAPCLYTLPFEELEKRVEMISSTPQELHSSLKIPFFRSIRQLFESMNCDYTAFHPESHLVENNKQCRELLQAVQESVEYDRNHPRQEPSLWFFKDRRESFGSGVTVRSGEQTLKVLNECRSLSKKLFVQKGVNNVVKYEGRNSQGRAYFLVSSYDPATVWLFMGYFNIAAENSFDVDASVNKTDDDTNSSTSTGSGATKIVQKNLYVTNMASNQRSSRLLLSQFLKGRSQDELRLLKKNIKEAALTSFLALKPKLGHGRSSFSIFGFDYLVQTDMNVKVLETNCNCELFANPEIHGKERVDISANLIRGALDIVMGSKLNPKAFSNILSEFVAPGSDNGALMRDAQESLDLDASTTKVRDSWELLYSEAVEPHFSVVTELKESCVPMT